MVHVTESARAHSYIMLHSKLGGTEALSTLAVNALAVNVLAVNSVLRVLLTLSSGFVHF